MQTSGLSIQKEALLVDFFKATTRLKSTQNSLINFISLNKSATSKAHIILPKANTRGVEYYIENLPTDVNSTFYTTWEDVTSKTRFDLFVDQLIHYCTNGEYVPNEHEIPEVHFKSYTPIRYVEKEEMYNMIMEVANSGIALNSYLVAAMGEYLYLYSNETNTKIDIYNLGNRELKLYLYKKFETLPINGEEIIRYINLLATNSTLLVKNDETVELWGNWAYANKLFLVKNLTDERIIELSKYFYRFKILLLALKVGPIVNPKINKIRNLARKYHTPMKQSYWADILSIEKPLDEVKKKAMELNSFRLISLYNATAERILLMEENNGLELYKIRNGKAFFRQRNNNFPMVTYEYMKALEKIFKDIVVTRLRDKFLDDNKYVRFNEDIDLACPTSEKDFIGDIPCWSKLNMADANAVLGIYWRNEWGTHDFDLSFCDYGGHKVGWNAAFNSQQVVFSGDMIQANPEATELLYFPKKVVDGIVYCNRFNGNEGSKFRFLTGIVDSKKAKHSFYRYMLNPSEINFTTEMISQKRETQLGVTLDGNFYFCNLDLSNARISNSFMNDNDKNILYKRKKQSKLMLSTLLKEAGFRDVDKETFAEDGPTIIPAIDLKVLNKSKLITLFS